MREIFFRGKRTDNSEWVEGYFVETLRGNELIPHIVPFDTLAKNFSIYPRYRVFCETVEEYTGLTDKNGRKIFEGDILKDTDYITGNKLHCIEYGNASFVTRQIENGVLSKYAVDIGDREFGILIEDCVVVGNIHDNPELLRSDQQ
jgi:uncharacterized phage protein (TIGR01671 family)